MGTGNDTGQAGAANAANDEAAADLLARLDEVLEGAGIFLATELRDGLLVLSGEVDSAANRQAALDVATALAEPRGIRVDDSIDVLPDSPDTASEDDTADGSDAFRYLDPDRDDDNRLDAGFEGEPDFTGDIGTTDSQQAAAEAIPYFPPTDPVIRQTDDRETLEVVGGFSATSMDDQVGGASFDDRNDDDLNQAVMRELAEDSLTIDLDVRAATADGVVVLRGMVDSLEDAENAEAVASRVPGVKEVREEITVTAFQGRGGSGA